MLDIGFSTISGFSFGIDATAILSADRDIPTMNNIGPSSGQDLYDDCSSRSSCVTAELETMIRWVYGAPALEHLRLQFTGDLTVANFLQAVTGLQLSSATQGAMNKWLGTANLGILNWDPGACAIQAAGAASALGISLMFRFSLTCGRDNSAFDIRVGLAEGCLGAGGVDSCMGILLERPENGTAAAVYDDMAGQIKAIGWAGDPDSVSDWAARVMPSDLDHRDKLATHAVFVLSPSGIEIDVDVQARPSVGFVDLSSVLPSVRVRLRYVDGSLAFGFGLAFGEMASMRAEFSIFVGGLTTSADGSSQLSAPEFNHLNFDVDTSPLRTAIQSHANENWSSFWYFVSNTVLMMFSVIWFDYFRLGLTTTSFRVEASFGFLGIPLGVDLNMDLAMVTNVLSGDVSDAAQQSASALEETEVSDCDVDPRYGRQYYVETFVSGRWGYHNVMAYGTHEDCPSRTEVVRHCGEVASCGVEDRGFGEMGARHCCEDVTVTTEVLCYYVTSSSRAEYHLVTAYDVTYGNCAFRSRCELEHQGEDCQNFRIVEEYEANDLWLTNLNGYCDNVGNCPTSPGEQ